MIEDPRHNVYPEQTTLWVHWAEVQSTNADWSPRSEGLRRSSQGRDRLSPGSSTILYHEGASL